MKRAFMMSLDIFHVLNILEDNNTLSFRSTYFNFFLWNAYEGCCSCRLALKRVIYVQGVLITSEILFLPPHPQCKSAYCPLSCLGACSNYTPLGMLLGVLYLGTVETQKPVTVFKEVLSIQ